MSLAHGASIPKSGLVLYYDQQNTAKSWKGAPTTNLYTDGDFSSGSLHPVRSGTWQIVADPRNPTKRVLKATPSASNQYHGRDITVTVSTVYSLQMEIFVSPDFNGTNVQMYPEQGGGGANVAYDLTKKGTWQSIKFDGKSATTTNIRMLAYVLSAFTTGYVLFSNVQVEQQSFATPFVNGTRSNTQALLDLTNQKTITAASLTYASNNTFSFDGTNNYMTIPQPAITTSPNQWTIEMVMYPSSSDFIAISPNSAGIDHFVRYDGASQRINFQITEAGDVNNRARYSSVNSVPLNTFTHITLTMNNLTMKIYINGVLDSSYTETISIANWEGEWHIGQRQNGTFRMNGRLPLLKVYNRELTDSEARQNFNAVRGRYGI